jgi:hypothetical protein
VSEPVDAADAAEDPDKGPLRRTLDVCLFAPVGVAVTVAEDLPELISKGRQRVEMEISNARVVGRFVVRRGQGRLTDRLEELLRSTQIDELLKVLREEEAEEQAEDAATALVDVTHASEASETTAAPDVEPDATEGSAISTNGAPPSARPAPDAAALAIVGGALSDYDTLSASQVVRRLESLGPDELRAVQRYEASHRNRRTILNRAGQLLGEAPSAPAG